ncbi:hypothetical protein [Paenibacillus azoreducens]|uniref:hypothetical protein n=1 Tax=Paenibacillus azoreducens TaxID=116718 RepID=UPI001BB34803|nr:hypothetical protein [Paenibacillus azoreducens]
MVGIWKEWVLQQEQLLDEVWALSGRYIEDLNNKNIFLQTFLHACSDTGTDPACDYLEMFDSDPPEFISIVQTSADTIEVIAEIGYGLSVWHHGKQLGKVTAAARGIFTFKLVDQASRKPVPISDEIDLALNRCEICRLELQEMHNIEEYYDDYTMVF